MIEKIFCDGCGHVISDPDKAWQFEANAKQYYITHPNNHCADKVAPLAPQTHYE